jgi:hypothetical protein
MTRSWPVGARLRGFFSGQAVECIGVCERRTRYHRAIYEAALAVGESSRYAPTPTPTGASYGSRT